MTRTVETMMAHIIETMQSPDRLTQEFWWSPNGKPCGTIGYRSPVNTREAVRRLVAQSVVEIVNGDVEDSTLETTYYVAGPNFPYKTQKRKITARDDSSTDCAYWTTAKLMREINKYANLKSFASPYNDIAADFKVGWHGQVNKDQPTVDDFCRDQTRLYRATWMQPLLDELASRLDVSLD